MRYVTDTRLIRDRSGYAAQRAARDSPGARECGRAGLLASAACVPPTPPPPGFPAPPLPPSLCARGAPAGSAPGRPGSPGAPGAAGRLIIIIRAGPSAL